jgi:propionyl-CoA carboxylase alpha chain
MGKAACDVAKACNYSGAGTVEFLLDENLNFYFLEMNTRLQVEHPVTEIICGLDLVEQQINVARGEKLHFTQSELKINGHAIELRICAEDPLNNFLPSIGTLVKYQLNQIKNVRLDSGYTEGMEIPIQYDPMLAKLIAFGKNREDAIQTLIQAIDNFTIEGIQTTLNFGKFVLQHQAFTSGQFDTNFINQYFSPMAWEESFDSEKEAAAALVVGLFHKNNGIIHEIVSTATNWKTARTN